MVGDVADDGPPVICMAWALMRTECGAGPGIEHRLETQTTTRGARLMPGDHGHLRGLAPGQGLIGPARPINESLLNGLCCGQWPCLTVPPRMDRIGTNR